VDGITALHSFVERFQRGSRTAFGLDRHVSGLEAVLPTGTSAHIAMPFFSGDTAMFVVLVSTRSEGRYFDQVDTAFVRSIATVLKALVVQSRAVEAEQKKTMVMSRFSHAMRTPLHGMLSSIGMLKEAFDRKDMEEVADTLVYLDATSMDLEKLTNDILDEESSGRLDQGRRSSKSNASSEAGPLSVEVAGDGDLIPRTPAHEGKIEFCTSPIAKLLGAETIHYSLDRSLRVSDTLEESRPLKVLIVEDNEISRKLLAKAVKRSSKNIELTQACDGVEGLSAFCKVQPDLVFTDVNMPFMDGVTSAKAMRGVEIAQRWTRCPIYTVTGLGQADSRLKRDALSATIDGWLVKGQHRLEEIQAIVRDLQLTINNRHAEQERTGAYNQ
jgi:CheY-like chemotaxis protein